ncbi:ATP-binding cassette domain-containing protein [Dactylosporangium sp. NPDC049140]|uniref:ATP-binding cassette domain-containing protein n=1 Tax=Dactylosporangium sp. NPDC049140 TaxID=3155647 RepID=UPI00340B5162
MTRVPGTLPEAVRLCRRAAPRLTSAAVAVPLAQSVLVGAQLLVLQRLAGALLAAPLRLTAVAGPALLLVATLAVLAVLDNVSTIVRELLTERVRQDAARRIHAAIGALDLVEFDRPETHDRVLRASSTDFRPAQVVRALTTLATMTLRGLVLAGFVVSLVPLLVPLLLVPAVPVLLVARALAGERYSMANRLTPLERRRVYYHRLLTAREPAAEVRSFGLGAHLAARYEELSRARETELRTLLRRQFRRMLLGQAAFAVAVLAVLGLLGWLFASGRAPAAALIAAAIGVAQIAALLGGLGYPVGELAEAALFLGDQQALVAPPPHPGSGPVAALSSLAFDAVSFSYPTGSRPAVDGVSLTVGHGRIVAFVGANGSGKTTLAKLAATLFDPSSGAVRWNGTDVRELDRDVLRARIGVVFQDFQTYSDTIAGNVAPLPGADPARVGAALRAAGFRPGEVDPGALIGPEHEGGTALSGGQEQRVAVARALYRAPDLLILDEPASSLDARAEHGLLAHLRAAGGTTILISHRLANVAEADHIYVLDGGRVIEHGRHPELMAAGGVYHELFTLQAALYTDGGFSFGPTS